ncbi:hypothetical protein VTJ49DRAFT_5225 [Mycothermus thermophilus]|uniref:Uncharacterized protein n=1 Tax=Humicola insolens TaxID=85995 RepID=A0ABR3V481_HUMIN
MTSTNPADATPPNPTPPSANENATSAPISIFSSGLVQITGLSTLVGGRSLAEMCLGLKAAPGLVWSSVSCLGILQAVRAFVAGAIPSDVWRDVVGLRTGVVDDALGFCFWTDVTRPIAGKTMQSKPGLLDMRQGGERLAEERRGIWLGVKSEFGRSRSNTQAGQESLLDDKIVGWHSLLAGDIPLKSTLATASTFGEKAIYVTRFIPDDTAQDYRLVDWILIGASLLKISEAVALYRMGSAYLWWSNSIGFACCLFSAVVLQVLDAGRDSYDNLDHAADFLIGDLPSYKRFGTTDKKIILGQPISVRRSALWRTAWTVGAIANLVGLSITFYILAKEEEDSSTLVYVWLGFQAFWVLARTIVYHMIPEARGAPNINVSPQPLESLPETSQARVLRLLLATSLLQTHEHVRVSEAYQEDIQSVSSPQQLIQILELSGWQISDALPHQINQTLNTTTIEAVIGEEFLRTFAWISEAKVDNADLYDAVVALFRVSSCECYLVPGVRVLAVKSIRQGPQDPEATVPVFDPRGTLNKDKRGYWVYWFPIQDPTSTQWSWLEIQCDPFSVLGKLRGYQVLTDAALDKELRAGVFSISLRGTAELLTALEASRTGSHILLNMVKSLRICPKK